MTMNTELVVSRFIGRAVLVSFFLGLLFACHRPETVQEPFTEIASAPQVLAPGVISSSNFHETINAIAEGNDTLYFSRSDQDFKQSTLFRSAFVDGKWEVPEQLAFSGEHYDAGLSFSPDGAWAFFTSKRLPEKEGLNKEWNIWKVPVQDQSWGSPEVLDFPINSDGQECCLTMNKQGMTYFASNRLGSWDIYYAQYIDGHFQSVTILSDSINSSAGEWPGYIDESGSTLILSSIRKQGLGGDDLYLGQLQAGKWSKAQLLPSPINSSSYEDSPLLSADGEVILFSSWRETDFSKGMSNIYVAGWPALSQ